MYLSAYHFDGSPEHLLARYDELMKAYPEDIVELHLCITSEQGITILDGCPSREVFEQFHRSEEFRASVARAGLPEPRIEPLGEVQAVHAMGKVPLP